MSSERQRTLGVRLKEARRRAGFSQEEAAEAVGVHPITISKYERDIQDPNTDALVGLARLYGVTVDWLLAEHRDISYHGLSDREKTMTLVMSHPSLVLRVADGWLSDEAVADLCEYAQYICWRDGKQYPTLPPRPHSETPQEK